MLVYVFPMIVGCRLVQPVRHFAPLKHVDFVFFFVCECVCVDGEALSAATTYHHMEYVCARTKSAVTGVYVSVCVFSHL